MFPIDETRPKPGLVKRLEDIASHLAKLPADAVSETALPVVVESVRSLRKLSAELEQLLAPRVDLHSAASVKGKPESFAAVKFYADKIGLPEVEAEKFWNYFCAKGWRIGNQKHVMQSWHHALVNWRLNWQSRFAGPANGSTYTVRMQPNAAPISIAEREMRQLERIADL